MHCTKTQGKQNTFSHCLSKMSIVLRDQPYSILGNIFLVLGISSSLLVSGIHFSSSFLTVPLLYKLPADTSTQIFSKFYRSSAKIAAPLTALATTMLGLSAYFFAASGQWFNIALGHAAGLTFAAFFWKRLVMMGVTGVLLDNSAGVKLTDGVDEAEVERLFRRWKWMNLVRGCLILGGGLVGLVVLSAGSASRI